ncbi:MAG: exodeoxyribonuclease VII large subunit [Burkholderiaceae bacterium]|nr:exodeoxyribonuclease VII large subunit [Burkholderiaceae bacterium]
MIPTASNPSQRILWDVSALLLAVGDALSARFGAVGVRGELSGFTRAASGHCYFTLKDADGAAATLRCAMFRRAASMLAFAPADGQRVELRGRLAVYEPRGELQFVVEAMQRAGVGSLYEQFLRLRDQLQAAGLFDPARKRPIAPHPRAVGIVTSLQAAALHDVLTAFARRAPHLTLVVYPAPVQGADAPAALVRALAAAAARREVDTLLLVRGGGSLEDLWAFNDEALVRAVAASPIPVVCGVGHETDVTLCDLAADLRAPTPTAAAEMACTARQVLLDALQAQAEAMRHRVARRLQTQAQRLDLTALRLARPGRAVARQRQRVDTLANALASALGRRVDHAASALPRRADRLQHAARGTLHDARQRLDALAQRLHALDPRAVLSRGYAWVEAGDGRPVTQVAQLTPGQTVQGVWADGRAALQVDTVTPAAGAAPATAPRRRTGSRGSA